jgi:carboxylesterase
MNPRFYTPKFNPAASYDDALVRIDQLRAEAPTEIYPECLLQLMSHGQKQARSIVFFHGFTSCPHQFEALGKEFHSLGYNVLIPRVVYHGETGENTDQIAQLKANDLVNLVDESLNIAHGLGEQIYVMGLSMGGVMTTWAAQNRPDVTRAMIISPAMGVTVVKRFLLPAVVIASFLRSDEKRWWDPILQEKTPRPRYNYAYFTTKSISQFLYLGIVLRTQARRRRPRTPSVVVVTNANDQQVDNQIILKIGEQWQRRGFQGLQTYEFPANLGLTHDLIDPEQPGARIDLVNPKLIELMTGTPVMEKQ